MEGGWLLSSALYGGGQWRDQNSRESLVPPPGKDSQAPGHFPPLTLFFYFLFQKAKQKQKQVSHKGTWAGGWGAIHFWLWGPSWSATADIYRTRGEGAQNSPLCPQSHQA